jgi:hypothetical protein
MDVLALQARSAKAENVAQLSCDRFRAGRGRMPGPAH